jgi:hypothetical protein
MTDPSLFEDNPTVEILRPGWRLAANCFRRDIAGISGVPENGRRKGARPEGRDQHTATGCRSGARRSGSGTGMARRGTAGCGALEAALCRERREIAYYLGHRVGEEI